jgi:hypothetical protein
VTHLPDVIYPVRAGDSNDELRFSLRSLDMNLPHGRVWIVGHKPSWVTGVEHIPGNTASAPRANLWRNLELACSHPDISDDVLIFNDDFFVLGRQESVPVLYRCKLAEQLDGVKHRSGLRGWWPESLMATAKALADAGFEDPLSYELHTPFPCSKALMGDTLARFAHIQRHNPPQWRTLYGVTQQIGGVKHRDGKCVKPGPLRRPFHSTDDLSWRYFRARFVQLFPAPSRYEIPTANARSLVSVTPRNHLRSTRRRVRA